MIESPLPSLHPRHFTITFFTVIMSTGLKLGENWDDVPKFSVILSGTRDGGPYKREDFLVGLAGVIGNVSTRVLSFGPLVQNSECYLVLQDQLRPVASYVLNLRHTCYRKFWITSRTPN